MDLNGDDQTLRFCRQADTSIAIFATHAPTIPYLLDICSSFGSTQGPLNLVQV